MKKGFFITGTDTGVGKTTVTAGLVTGLQKQGYRVLPVKPLSSGAKLTAAGLRNADGILLKNTTAMQCGYHHINPLVLARAVAPHVAAAEENKSLSVAQLLQACEPSFALEADYYCVEGAGGWLVPLNDKETMADFAKALQWPVILVVGMRLGCLNHALLTYQGIQKLGLTVAGWVANVMDPTMDCLQENIATLAGRLPAALLGVVPYTSHDPVGQASAHLNVSRLVNERAPGSVLTKNPME